VRDAVQAREEAQSRLALSEKLSALGQLAGGVAHDFNNIMQGVIGGASIIQRRARDPTEVIRYARMIDETARRGVSVTSRLLTLARRDDLRAEPVNVAALLKGLRELLRHTLGAAIVIKLDVAEDLALILADQSRLETVLVNLATNARDAMREGDAQARARTLLHHQGARQRHRPRPVDGLWFRRTVGWRSQGFQRARLWNDCNALAADGQSYEFAIRNAGTGGALCLFERPATVAGR